MLVLFFLAVDFSTLTYTHGHGLFHQLSLAFSQFFLSLSRAARNRSLSCV